MTTFSGGLGTIYDGYADAGPTLSDNFFTTETANVLDAVLSGMPPTIATTFTSGQPVPMQSRTIGGAESASLSGNDDWYHRVHIVADVVALGNVLAASQTTVHVWNAHLHDLTLQALTSTGDTNGLTLTGPSGSTPPWSMPSLEEADYIVAATIAGASIFSVTYTFNFGSESHELLVTGQRVFAWTFPPNWSSPVEERLEWKTDVLTSYNGTEQRLALRSTPRRVMAYQFVIDNNSDRRKFEAILHNWGGKQWMLPVWTEGEPLPETVEAGDYSITLERLSGDWKVDGTAIIVRGPFDYEAITVAAIAGTTITTADPVFSGWTPGTRIYPAVSASLSDVQALDRFTGEIEGGRCDFMIADAEETVPAYSSTDYKGFPVVPAPHWSQDITNDYARKLSTIDYMIGKFKKTDEAGMPFQVISHNMTADGKAEIDQLRAFLYHAKGKQGVFWLPTYCPDLILYTEATSGSTYIDVEPGFIAQHLWGLPNRRDIMVELLDGSVYYRRLTDVTDAGDYERLSLETGIAVTLNSSNVSRISWMSAARLDSDSLSLSWRHNDWVDCSFNWRTVRDDI